MCKFIITFLLAVCVFPLEDGLAQGAKVTGEHVLGTVITNEEAEITPDSLLSFVWPQVILREAFQVGELSDYEAALRAAKTDPGILIYNDFTAGKIICIKPEGKVDPHIIINLSKGEATSTDSK